MADPNKGGQPAPETKDESKPKDGEGTGGKPPVEKSETPLTPEELLKRLRAKEAETAAAKAEAARLNKELDEAKKFADAARAGSEGVRKHAADTDAKAKDAIAAAEFKAKKAEDAAKAAIIAADKKAKDAEAMVARKLSDAIDHHEIGDASGVSRIRAQVWDDRQPPKKTATATADPPTTRTETQPTRREPDPPRPTKVAGDDCGDGKCCCHPWWTTVLWVAVGTIVVAALGALGWWLATKSSSGATAITATAPATDPLAADKGEFLTHCQLNGGTFADCLNGFEASTR